MSVRDRGLRRVAAVTVALAAAAIVGSAAAAVAAWAHTRDVRAEEASPRVTNDPPAEAVDGGAGAPSAPSVAPSAGQPHATSGGS